MNTYRTRPPAFTLLTVLACIPGLVLAAFIVAMYLGLGIAQGVWSR